MPLAEPVDAPDPLLHPHRVPGHVVVDEGAAELEVEALGGGVGAEQQVGLAEPEPAFRVVPADPAPPPAAAAAGRDLSAPSREAHQAPLAVPLKLVAEEVHGVRVLGEHHRLPEARLAERGQRLLQGRDLAVRRARPDAVEETLDVGAFLGGERPALDLRQLLRVGGLVRRLVVGRVFVLVQAEEVRPAPAFAPAPTPAAASSSTPDGVEPPLQGGAKRTEAAREPPAVDGHHEPDRRPLGRGRLVVRARDVVLDRLVEAALRRRHLDEPILHPALRDRRRQHPRLEVAAEQLAGMP